jgi:hypothetical protein
MHLSLFGRGATGIRHWKECVVDRVIGLEYSPVIVTEIETGHVNCGWMIEAGTKPTLS